MALTWDVLILAASIQSMSEHCTFNWKFCYCRCFATVGVDPTIMGIGLAVAIPVAVKRVGLELDDIGLFEINEVTIAS